MPFQRNIENPLHVRNKLIIGAWNADKLFSEEKLQKDSCHTVSIKPVWITQPWHLTPAIQNSLRHIASSNKHQSMFGSLCVFFLLYLWIWCPDSIYIHFPVTHFPGNISENLVLLLMCCIICIVWGFLLHEWFCICVTSIHWFLWRINTWPVVITCITCLVIIVPIYGLNWCLLSR